ncbi:MAG: Spy/CpxP family protein refolding chaperone [Acidobacteria bacterium]|nr:Spy/CpxP family protein refolding chaperone [Acidobacteriota bacterium]
MKLTGTKKILGGIALAGAMALTGVVGVAQQQQKAQDGGKDRAGWNRGGREGRKGRHGMEGFGGRFAEKLNLTDAQKQQMEQIRARFQESTKSLHEQARANRGKDFDAFNGGAFNESAVRAAAQARANMHVEMEVARARMMSEIYNILTPEQKAQLAQERQQREQRRQQWRANRGGQVQEN